MALNNSAALQNIDDKLLGGFLNPQEAQRQVVSIPAGLSIRYVENGWIVYEYFHHRDAFGREWVASTSDELAALIKRYGVAKEQEVRPKSAI